MFSPQKLMGVGVPFAAASLWRPAHCHEAHALSPAEFELQPTRRPSWTNPADLALYFARALLEEVAIAFRGLYLFWLFVPVVSSAPWALVWEHHRAEWMELLRWTLERAGPAFIKWGQWAATRPDLFPQVRTSSRAGRGWGAVRARLSDDKHLVFCANAVGRPMGVVFSAGDQLCFIAGHSGS